MTLVRYNPDRAFARCGRDFDSVFDSFLNFPSVRSLNNQAFVPRVDITEDKENMTVVAEIPGMEKDEVRVFVEDGVLTISGERKAATENKESSSIRTELITGTFSRSFTLPDHLDVEKIGADYKNGLLTITLPKTEKAKPKEIKVAVN